MIATQIFDIGGLINELLDGILAVYPIVAEKGAPTPFAVYRRTATLGRNTKDRYDYEETVQYEINVVTQGYPQGIELAKAVKKALEGKRGKWGNLRVTAIRMTGADERWSADTFVQTLFFSITIDTH